MPEETKPESEEKQAEAAPAPAAEKAAEPSRPAAAAEPAKAEAPKAEAPKAEAPKAEAPPAEAARKPAARKAAKKTYFWGTGRRKTSVARVRIRPGTGLFQVNGKELKDYFSIERHRTQAASALAVTNTARKVDVFVNVRGGGPSGQAGATIMGVARALLEMDAGLAPALRSQGYLTRDARKVERKKYGRRGARRSFQYSKR